MEFRGRSKKYRIYRYRFLNNHRTRTGTWINLFGLDFIWENTISTIWTRERKPVFVHGFRFQEVPGIHDAFLSEVCWRRRRIPVKSKHRAKGSV